jgi:hypothetical protein
MGTKGLFQSLARELRAIRASLERIEGIVEAAAREEGEMDSARVEPDSTRGELVEPRIEAADLSSLDRLGTSGSDGDTDEASGSLAPREVQGDRELAAAPSASPAADDFFAMLGLDRSAGLASSAPAEAEREAEPFDPFSGPGAGAPEPPEGLQELRQSKTASATMEDAPVSDLPDPFAEIAAASSTPETEMPSDDELLQFLGSVKAGPDNARPPAAAEESRSRPEEEKATPVPSRGTRDPSASEANKFDMSPDDLESIFGWKS